MYDEFGEVAGKAGIKEWMGKQVDRKYAFEEPDVPQEASYLKVLYSFDRKYHRVEALFGRQPPGFIRIPSTPPLTCLRPCPHRTPAALDLFRQNLQ